MECECNTDHELISAECPCCLEKTNYVDVHHCTGFYTMMCQNGDCKVQMFYYEVDV